MRIAQPSAPRVPSGMTGPVHDRAVIIASGDEVVTGQLLDTNSRYMADKLVASGVLPVEHITLPDELGTLVEGLRRSVLKAPLVIMSGGLGPTDGDLTRAALAELLGESLVLDESARSMIGEMLARRGRELTARQERQAMRPASARCLPNMLGTAPGLHATVRADDQTSDVFCLPGPPGELKPMFERHVLPRLCPPPGRTIVTRLLHIVGIAEADCVVRLGDLLRRDAVPLVGITASGGILTLRIRFDGAAEPSRAVELVDQAEARARSELGEHVFAAGEGQGHLHLASTVIELLTRRGQTLSVVESCTGGMLGELITTVPGSSSAFVGGYLTYANRMKESIGVEVDLLRTHGAVSREVATSMADHGLERSGTDWCLAITGIAGPDGGGEHKPVGTVHIGLARRGAPTSSRHFLFSGDRADVRGRSAVSALAMLYFALRGRDSREPRLLWQVG